MSGKKSNRPISGPYRATKLWNDAVRGFYNGMPVSRHWRGLRQYERCFTATEAIDWLHVHLQSNPNFGTSVSREQTTKLLRKFVKAGLIEDVRGCNNESDDLKDNRELFRFSNKSPLKALRTPRTPGRVALSTLNTNNCLDIDGASPALKNRKDRSFKESPKGFRRQNSSRGSFITRKVGRVLGENAANEAKDTGGMQECRLIAKPPTKEETNKVWKQVFLDKLNVICNRLLFGDYSILMSHDVVNAEFLHHNMTQITSRGVVQVPEGYPDDLPNWILTAMKCMAHWPNSADISCNIPNYPGVEKDVFKIVREFFTNMAVPLIPFDLYEAFIRLYIGAEFLDITYRSNSPNCSGNSNGHDGSYEPHNLEGGDSVENLILNMSISSQQKTSTPYLDEENVDEDTNPFRKRMSFRRKHSKLEKVNEFHTPTLRNKMQDLSIPQSLKLRRLKEYTDFKEDNLYPTLLEGSREASTLGICSENLEKSRAIYQPRSELCDSVVSKQAETVRSVKSNDLVRRMKKEKEASHDNGGIIRSNEIEGISLPDNCCFETAFTSDSPKTRIIPQKSVDTIHLKDGDKSNTNVRPRPISIAVTSLVGLDSHCSDINIWDTTRKDNTDFGLSCNSTVMSNEKFVTAPIHSPLSRSRSAGNLHSIDLKCSSQKQSDTPKSNDSSYRSLASRLMDSVKRKNNQSGSVSLKRISKIKDSHDVKTDRNTVRHLRTKSGGYMNLGLASGLENMDETQSIKSHDTGLKHLRTKSGGFLNLALVPSNNSIDHSDSFETLPSARTVQSDLSIQEGSVYSRLNGVEGYAHIVPTASANPTRSQNATPDGCLSHVLSSSGSTCSSGRSLYYSAHSCSSRNSTPILPQHSLPKRNHYSFDDKENIEKGVTPISMVDGDLSKHLSSSANELSDGWADRTPYGQVPPYAEGGLWRHYHSSPRLLTREGKEAAITSAQLLLLLLNPGCRRKLHLLLRMMSKMSNNEKLNVSDKHTTRAMVLNTFSRSILLCDQEADYDELLSLRIISFLMDNHEEIMRPPQDLSVLVHRKLTQMQRSQIVYDSTVWDRSMTLAYCQQVSQAQYERQKMTGSQQFLSQLLDQIVTNDKLTNKEKRKKLKEFKSLYPEVYNERFPSEVPVKTENRRSKLKSFMKLSSLTSLTRSRTLRL